MLIFLLIEILILHFLLNYLKKIVSYYFKSMSIYLSFNNQLATCLQYELNDKYKRNIFY